MSTGARYIRGLGGINIADTDAAFWITITDDVGKSGEEHGYLNLSLSSSSNFLSKSVVLVQKESHSST